MQLTFDHQLEVRADAVELLAKLLGFGEEGVSTIETCLDLLFYHGKIHHGVRAVAYRRFFIPKPSGGRREILAPVENPPLKQLSRRILDEILNRQFLNYHIEGWRTSHSIRTNALAHLQGGANHLLNVDIKDCFPSTPIARIQQVYWDIIGDSLLAEGQSPEVVRELVGILSLLSTFQYGRARTKVLPMGAPTSSALMNLVLHPFDCRLKAQLTKVDDWIVYTRFGDDVSISSPEPLPSCVYGIVVNLLGKFGFQLNGSKTRWMSRGGSSEPLEVTGVVIGEDRLLLSDRRLQKYELELIKAFTKYQPGTMPLPLVSKIRGIIGIAKMIYEGQLPPRLANAITTIQNSSSDPAWVGEICFGSKGKETSLDDVFDEEWPY